MRVIATVHYRKLMQLLTEYQHVEKTNNLLNIEPYYRNEYCLNKVT